MMARHDAPRPRTGGRDTSHLLVDERRTIAFLPSLACLLGERRALVLQQVHFLEAREGETVAGGRRYVFRKWSAWKRDFRWMSLDTIRAVFYGLRKKGLLDVAGVVGPQGEAGYAVNHDVLDALYEANPDAGCEPDDEEAGRVRKFRTPPNRNRKRARALRTPAWGFYSPPPESASQEGRAQDPGAGGECARAVQMELRESVNSEGDREEKETAAAQARAREGVAAERAAPEPAAAAGAGAAEAMPPPPAPLPPSHPAAVAALVRAGFAPDDAHRLAAETAATEHWVEWLHRKAAKAAGKRPGVDVRGYVVAGLRRRWVPEDPGQQPPPPPTAAQQAAREQAERTAGEIRSRAEAAARVEDDRARVERELGELPGEQLDAIWTEILPDVPDAVRLSVVRRGGPRASWAAKYAIHDELRRRKRLHACPPTAAAGAAAPRAPSPAGEEGTPNPERR